jgi:hypothetical protein
VRIVLSLRLGRAGLLAMSDLYNLRPQAVHPPFEPAPAGQILSTASQHGAGCLDLGAEVPMRLKPGTVIGLYEIVARSSRDRNP